MSSELHQVSLIEDSCSPPLQSSLLDALPRCEILRRNAVAAATCKIHRRLPVTQRSTVTRTSTLFPCTSFQPETSSLYQNRASTLSCASTSVRFRSIRESAHLRNKKVHRGQARRGHLRGHLAHHETMRCELVLDTEPLCHEVTWLATTLTTCDPMPAVASLLTTAPARHPNTLMIPASCFACAAALVSA